MEAINAPIITIDDDKEYGTYLLNVDQLESARSIEVVFPIDFSLIEQAIKNISKKHPELSKTHEYIKNNGLYHVFNTRSGFNPMIEDYLNKSIIFSLHFVLLI